MGETRNTKEEFGKHVLGKYLEEEYVELLLSGNNTDSPTSVLKVCSTGEGGVEFRFTKW